MDESNKRAERIWTNFEILKESSTRQYNVPSFWAEFLAVWSKYHAWLHQFPDKSLNFGLLYGRVFGPGPPGGTFLTIKVGKYMHMKWISEDLLLCFLMRGVGLFFSNHPTLCISPNLCNFFSFLWRPLSRQRRPTGIRGGGWLNHPCVPRHYFSAPPTGELPGGCKAC